MAALVERLRAAGHLDHLLATARQEGYQEGYQECLTEQFGGASLRDVACQFLVSTLADGPCASGTLHEAAESLGISARTLRRAAKQLAVRKAPATPGGPWFWSLPESSKSARE